PDVATRRVAFWFTAFSAGFGWLFPLQKPVEQSVVDLWQPESVTFLCLYVNGLFCAALALMVGLYLLLLGPEDQDATAGWGRVAGAGLLGLVLGNIHSYDVITVTGVWAAYVAVRGIAARRFPTRTVVDACVAGLVALPSTLYQYYLYRTDPVFHLRAET